MAIATFGSILVSSSTNLIILSIGLILCGAGINPSLSIVYVFFSQVVEDKKRQKFTVALNFSFIGGSFVITLSYYLIGHWRIISILFTTIPIIVSLIFIFIYVQQTPQFLLKKTNQQALKALNRIGYINYGKTQMISLKDVQNVKKHQQLKQKEQNQKDLKQQNVKSIIDLFKYSSLRFTTIGICLLAFINFSMYYGPVVIISKIGFNIFVSSVTLSVSELLIYIPSYLYIQKFSRKKSGIFVFLIASISSGMLAFIQKPQICNYCWQSIVELIIIFIFRSSISFYYSIFAIYLVQLFPSSISGLGNGFASIFATIGSTSTPLIIGSLQRMDFNIMNLFCCYGIIGIFFSSLLKQTKGKIISAQIDQIRIKKQKILLEELQKSQNFQQNSSNNLKFNKNQI